MGRRCASRPIRSGCDPWLISAPPKEAALAVFPIRVYPDAVLRTAAAPVGEIGGNTRRLIEDMVETMYEAPGVGLAAPQIGISLRVFVFDAGDGPLHVINPVLEETSGSWEYEEGCLSVPEKFWPIKRPSFARISGLDVEGNLVEYEGEELMGRVLQHEFDHLDGTLLLRRLGRRARKEALREMREESLGLRGPG